MNNLQSDLVFKQKIYRWDVYWCSMDQDIKTTASVLIGKPNRPCIVISNDTYNVVSNKVLVLPFCSNNSGIPDDEYIGIREKEGDVLIPMVLNRDETSFLIVEQPRLLSKKMLQGYIGTLDVNTNRDLAIKITESIFKYLIDPEVFKDTDIFKSLTASNNSSETPIVQHVNNHPVELNHVSHSTDTVPEEKKSDEVKDSGDENSYYDRYFSGELSLSLLALYTHDTLRNTIINVSERQKERNNVSKCRAVSF